jgi:hypothetical protein
MLLWTLENCLNFLDGGSYTGMRTICLVARRTGWAAALLYRYCRQAVCKKLSIFCFVSSGLRELSPGVTR